MHALSQKLYCLDNLLLSICLPSIKLILGEDAFPDENESHEKMQQLEEKSDRYQVRTSSSSHHVCFPMTFFIIFLWRKCLVSPTADMKLKEQECNLSINRVLLSFQVEIWMHLSSVV